MDDTGESQLEKIAEESPDQNEHAKLKLILQACRDNDLDGLIELATTTDGLVNDEIRQIAWPILLGPSNAEFKDEKETPWEDLSPHRDEYQVQLDVDRSFVYYPDHDTPKQLDARKKQLSDVIVEVLRRHPFLCYFQGFHDIVQVVLLVLGPSQSTAAVRRLSILRIRDFMLPNISGAISHLHLLPAILYAADPVLYKHLPSNTFFAISAILTLYAHDIQEYSDIARLFDFLLAREAVTSIYLFAAIVLSRKDELLELDPEEEKDMLHFKLSKLPKPLDLEALIAHATSLFRAHPPERLPMRAWHRISKNSVLKTTRDPTTLSCQSFEDGRIWFEAQAEEIRKQQAREELLKMLKTGLRKYRRPAMLGVTVAIGVLAWWLGRSRGMEKFWFPGFGRMGNGFGRIK
jgi:TBC1 domain family member 20